MRQPHSEPLSISSTNTVIKILHLVRVFQKLGDRVPLRGLHSGSFTGKANNQRDRSTGDFLLHIFRTSFVQSDSEGSCYADADADAGADADADVRADAVKSGQSSWKQVGISTAHHSPRSWQPAPLSFPFPALPFYLGTPRNHYFDLAVL